MAEFVGFGVSDWSQQFKWDSNKNAETGNTHYGGNPRACAPADTVTAYLDDLYVSWPWEARRGVKPVVWSQQHGLVWLSARVKQALPAWLLQPPINQNQLPCWCTAILSPPAFQGVQARRKAGITPTCFYSNCYCGRPPSWRAGNLRPSFIVFAFIGPPTALKYWKLLRLPLEWQDTLSGLNCCFALRQAKMKVFALWTSFWSLLILLTS